MTRNRVTDLHDSLSRLEQLPEAPPVIVVDNGSTDGTADHVRAHFPAVRVVRLATNRGVEARNIGVRLAETPYVAFCDDDSAWAPGALATAERLFEEHPRLGVVVAHVVVEPSGHDDPVSVAMRGSPVDDGLVDLPGVPVLGFLACAAAFRRSAYLDEGGFDPRFHFGGEEALLATDMAAAGWGIRYLREVAVHHHVSVTRDPVWRQRRDLRNDLWYLWLRRPARSAVRETRRRLATTTPRVAVPAITEALLRGAWVVRERQPVSPALEAQLRRLDG